MGFGTDEQLLIDILKYKEKFNYDTIIETGTFDGNGSTKIFAGTGKPVHTIESCLNHLNAARANLINFTNVTFHFGSSLNREEMKKFIKEDDIYKSSLVTESKIGVDTHSPQEFYLKEVDGFYAGVLEKEDLLFPLINNTKKQLVFLDSAGGVGYLEFLKFMSLEPEKLKCKILLLDDVGHVKHYRSVMWLKQNNKNVQISRYWKM